MAAAAAVVHASAVLPAAVVSAFCGLWKKESRPGSVSQDQEKEKKRKIKQICCPHALAERKQRERKRGGGIIICLFPLYVAMVNAPRGKGKSIFDIKRETIYLWKYLRKNGRTHTHIRFNLVFLGKARRKQLPKEENASFSLFFFLLFGGDCGNDDDTLLLLFFLLSFLSGANLPPFCQSRDGFFPTRQTEKKKRKKKSIQQRRLFNALLSRRTSSISPIWNGNN